MGTAAEAAANRRSIYTGQIRKLSTVVSRADKDKNIDPDQLSSIFGGSVKPKLATEKVNVHKEKEKALEWIAHEQKKFNTDVLKTSINSQIQITVNNIKKDQVDIMNDEQRQTRRLDRIDQLYTDLMATKRDVTSKNQTLDELTQKARQSFAKFNEVRGYNLEAIKAELQKKQAELDDVENDTELKNE